MKLTYGNLVRGTFFLLLISSSVLALLQKNPVAVSVAIIALVGIFADWAKEHYKKPEYKDHSEDVKKLQADYEALNKQFQEVKNDISIAKISTVIGKR